MWGANKWTDSMFKKYWWVVILLVFLFAFLKFIN
jgi:hypothetical protein